MHRGKEALAGQVRDGHETGMVECRCVTWSGLEWMMKRDPEAGQPVKEEKILY